MLCPAELIMERTTITNETFDFKETTFTAHKMVLKSDEPGIRSLTITIYEPDKTLPEEDQKYVVIASDPDYCQCVGCMHIQAYNTDHTVKSVEEIKEVVVDQIFSRDENEEALAYGITGALARIHQTISDPCDPITRYNIFLKLREMGFDMEKNSASDLLQCIDEVMNDVDMYTEVVVKPQNMH